MRLLVLLVAVAAVGLAAVAAAVKRRYAEANQVVPGVATAAPDAWAGAHTPEARLHRRLRDAVGAVRANPAGAGVDLFEARLALERQALTIDQRLVAVAALPEHLRADSMAAVVGAVEAIEAAVASLATAAAGPGDGAGLGAAVARVNERVALLAEARAELDDGGPEARGTPGT